MKFNNIVFSGIKADIERYLNRTHNKSGMTYSPASPFGQLLYVIEQMYEKSILYLKTSIDKLDIVNTNSNNPVVIKNTAILNGHIPTRAISSSGVLKLTVKSNSDIPFNRITILNKSTIKNKTNSLFYSINLGADRLTYNITPNYTFFLPIIQGQWKEYVTTGTGENLFSFNVRTNTRKEIENFNVEVLVNGEYYEIKKRLYDLLPNEKSCIVRTGINGGIDICFGNGSFGIVPDITSNITVRYLETDGSRGNIYRRTRNDFDIISDIFSESGETIDLLSVFDVDIYTDINFGADSESISFTKEMIPISSNNYVLALPQQYAYEIKKLGVFSHVNAYENNGSIFIVATPNINIFKNQSSDYFNIDLNAFYLDDYEKSKINKYLKSGGNIQLTKKYKIVNPELSFYAVNIFVMTYNDTTDDSVKSQIQSVISDYFLSLNRLDRIPKSDIIRIISNINDVHSVDIQFISKKNEDTIKQNRLFNNSNNTYTNNNGLDDTLGDIVFEPNEVPVLRGGWYDRNDMFYSDDINGNSLKAMNVIFKGKINR